MALLKKTNNDWQPSERPNLKVGETLEVTDYINLVKTGMAVLVDISGNELELPGQKFTCPICFNVFEGVMKLTEHLSTHLKKNQENLEEKTLKQNVAEKIAKEYINEPKIQDLPLEAVDTPIAEETKKEEIKAKRLAALAKARAARKTKIK